MTGTASKTVRVSRRFEAAPETVFDAWLDPSAVGRWLFVTPDGVMKKVEIDARVGGRFEIDEQRGETLARHVGTYLEIDRPRRLVFEFAAGAAGEALPPPTRVTVEIAPTDGGCLLTLIHEGVWADYEERTQKGWTMILDTLAETLGGDAMTKRSVAHYTFVIERTFAAPPALVFAAFADPAKKARWCCHENWESLQMDFRVGGREISRGSEPGGPVYAFDGLYQDIVTGERIIFAYTMDRDGVRVSASTATIEISREGDGAHLVFTDQGAYLDGLASPDDRERGTGEGLDNLAEYLRREAAV